jgi:hypothetical protein
MKNKLTDLNDHLFAQLERLSDESLTPEEIAKEVTRAEAIVGVADCIVANAGIQLKAVQLAVEHGNFVKVPFMQVEVREP